MSNYYKERLQLREDEVTERIDRLKEDRRSLMNAHDTEHQLFEDRMQRTDTDIAIFQKILEDLRKEIKKNE
tara:strand:+ start:162 stop:374 length:213 start_codon:yes stop_codon:yes gene_type:complete